MHNFQCAVCCLNDEKLLIASRIIKPWSKSTEFERTDLKSGLVLCVKDDKLFELEYITFLKNGFLKCEKIIKQYNNFYNENKNKRMNLSSKNTIKLPHTYLSYLNQINKYINCKKNLKKKRKEKK